MRGDSFHRSQRVAELIQQEISALIQFELKDPRIGFVTITGVEVSYDLQHAKIYYTVMGEEKQRRETAAGFAKALGFLRREIGKRLRLRLVPELSFQYDTSIEHGGHIETLLNQIHAESNQDNEDS
ncbi:MAG: 30S ribosome-binding factor RbfA [Desulfuromonas sp.]|nr:MAG: 30S ribosome-binding factor RbfA [Desulfuromonas sp.]